MSASETSISEKSLPKQLQEASSGQAALVIPVPRISGTLPAPARDKATKASNQLSSFLKATVKDCSIGLYRVQEHVQRRVPEIVKKRLNIEQIVEEQINVAHLDAVDAETVLSVDMKSCDLKPSIDLALRAIELKAAIDVKMENLGTPQSRKLSRSKKLLRTISDLYKSKDDLTNGANDVSSSK